MVMKDPKKFGIALLRYLDVVIGHNFPVDSKYLSFAGVGWALDTDFCFFSVLLPLRYPLQWEPQGTNLSMGGNICLRSHRKGEPQP